MVGGSKVHQLSGACSGHEAGRPSRVLGLASVSFSKWQEARYRGAGRARAQRRGRKSEGQGVRSIIALHSPQPATRDVLPKVFSSKKMISLFLETETN